MNGLSELEWSTGRLSYLAFMLLAFVAFIAVRRWGPKTDVPQENVSWEKKFILSMAAFIGGALSSKLPFVLSDMLVDWGNVTWASDGKTVTTGLAGAYFAVECTKRLLGVRIKTGDSYAVPLAVALAIGRLGCFFNGCCYGRHTDWPWGVDFLGDGPRHPSQLYEVAFHAAMAVLIWRWITSGQWRTHRLQAYLIAYCVFRFWSEWLRPEPVLALGLTFYQWFVLAFGIALAIQWAYEARAQSRRASSVTIGTTTGETQGDNSRAS